MTVVCALNANGVYECGTGGNTGPKPGDPNTTDLLITAKPAFGGIDVNWTWPDLNPEAVAYTILYRSLLPATESATLLQAAVQGSFYHDRIDNDDQTTYYYWIQVVSVYGTRSELIGPAWATAMPLIEQMIEKLTGQIDSGVLAQSLKADIARIELNSLGIDAEMIRRAAEDDALGVRIDQVGAYSGETRALLQEEVLARTSANEAFVTAINTAYATLNGNIAAVQQQVTALVTEVGSLAQQINKVESEFGADLAQVQVTLQTNIEYVQGQLVNLGARWTAMVSVNGLVGGFGVYNDGSFVEAGFDVDRFWIGRTGANNRKPFIVEGNTVYMDEAAINKLTFSKLRDEAGTFIVQNGKIKAQYLEVNTLVATAAQSPNYISGVQGWSLREDGTMEINGNVPGQGRLWLTHNALRTYYASGRLATVMGVNI